jgi:hypothetical protein
MGRVFCLRAGLSVEECIALGNAIMTYTGNSDKTDIKLAVESTSKRLEAKDKKVKGGPCTRQDDGRARQSDRQAHQRMART